jgi:hypothetical protein
MNQRSGTVTQVAKKFPTFYETQGFIAMFTRGLHGTESLRRKHSLK